MNLCTKFIDLYYHMYPTPLTYDLHNFTPQKISRYNTEYPNLLVFHKALSNLLAVQRGPQLTSEILGNLYSAISS